MIGAAVMAVAMVPVPGEARIPVTDPMHVPTLVSLAAVGPGGGARLRVLFRTTTFGPGGTAYLLGDVDCAAREIELLAYEDTPEAALAGDAPPPGDEVNYLAARRVRTPAILDYACEFARTRDAGRGDTPLALGTFEADEGHEPVTVDLLAVAPLIGDWVRVVTRETRASGTVCRAEPFACSHMRFGEGRAAPDCETALRLPLLPPKEHSYRAVDPARGWPAEQAITVHACARAQALGLWTE